MLGFVQFIRLDTVVDYPSLFIVCIKNLNLYNCGKIVLNFFFLDKY